MIICQKRSVENFAWLDNGWRQIFLISANMIKPTFSKVLYFMIDMSSWNQRFFSEPTQLIGDSHYMMLPQTFLYFMYMVEG